MVAPLSADPPRVGGHANRLRAISGPGVRGSGRRWRTLMDGISASIGSCACILAWSSWGSNRSLRDNFESVDLTIDDCARSRGRRYCAS